MQYKRKKMALYEVIGKNRLKSSYDKLSKQHEKKSLKDKPIAIDSTMNVPQAAAQWPKRPSIIQFNAGRIEISVPYQLAVGIVLGLVLVVLVVFRLGQNATTSRQQIPDSGGPAAVQNGARTTVAARKITSKVEEAGLIKAGGNNQIVIQTWKDRSQLEPVKRYFTEFGIETEIRKKEDWYYLVTMEKYENPQRPGTDGYSMKQRIIELGAKYKAPSGYKSFGRKPFHDAYGIRFDD